MTTTSDLAATHRSWGEPDDAAVRWLLEQGITATTLTEPYSVGAATVCFYDGAGTFDVDPNGARALTFRATDMDDVIDLVAWQPRTGQLASWRGAAFCLGDVDDAINPATYFAGGVLRVHRSPLEWLLAERDGIVILRPELSHAYLRPARVSFADAELAKRFAAWVQPPKPTVEIFLERRQAA